MLKVVFLLLTSKYHILLWFSRVYHYQKDMSIGVQCFLEETHSCNLLTSCLTSPFEQCIRVINYLTYTEYYFASCLLAKLNTKTQHKCQKAKSI